MKKNWSAITLTAIAVTSILSACAKDQAPPPVAPPAPAPVEQAAAPQDKPGKGEAELIVVTANVVAIDKKKRVVTLKYPDGKTAKIKCGPEVRNFAQIKIGDEVKAELLESVELFVADQAEKPTADRTSEVARAPKVAKPGFAAVESVEVKATVESIDYNTRDVVLKGPEGNMKKIKVGPEVKRLNEVKQGDTVVARLTKAVSITVSKPQ